MKAGVNLFESEERRIRAVYAKRQDKNQYSCFNPGYLFMLHESERKVLRLLARSGCAHLATKKILEIGCGKGHWLREFVKWGARPTNIVGIDLLHDSIAEAKHLSPNAVSIRHGNAATLEFPDATFDLILQMTVFTSVLDPEVKRQIASQMLRVLKPNGLILWYDYYVDNPWNPDVRGITKKEIYQLFPNCHIELSRIILVPPLVRLLAPYSWLACYLLERLRLFNTHYIGVIRAQTRENTIR